MKLNKLVIICVFLVSSGFLGIKAHSQPQDWTITQLNVANPWGYPAIDVAVDDQNGVHLSIGHLNDSGTTYRVTYWHRSRPGGAWSNEVVDEGNVRGPRIVLDESGAPHIFYTRGDRQVVHAVSSEAGWTRDVIAESGWLAGISTFSRGQPSAVSSRFYRDANGAGWYEYSFSYLTGEVWQKEVAFSVRQGQQGLVSYTLDSQGKVHLVLAASCSSCAPQLKYFVRTEQGWSVEPELLGTLDDRFANVAVDVDSNDRPYVWGVGSGSFWPSFLFHRKESVWTSERTPNSAYPITHPGRLFLVDESDSRHFAFIAGHYVYYRVSPEPGVWGPYTWLMPADYSLSLGLTPRGEPIVAYWRNSSYGGPPSGFFVAELITNMPPVASAGPDLVAVTGEPVYLDGTGSSDPEDAITNYNWDFGDGTTGSGAQPSHVYSEVGTYTVELTVTDDYGLVDADTATVVVRARPIADAGPDIRVLMTISTIVDGSASYDPDGEIVTYHWNFGDGATGSEAAVSHSWAQPGTFIATVLVTDNDGLTANDQTTVTVITPAEALRDVIAEVERLAQEGKLDDKKAGGLTRIAGDALSLIESGNNKAASRKLGDFIDRVNALAKSGAFTDPAEAQELVDSTWDIISVIDG